MSRPLTVGVSPHLSALTGARFVAAFAVLLCHFGPQADWPRWLTAYGREAVAFFFVLSGFVLTYNYAGRLPTGDWQAYLRFLRARFARVYPVHLLLLVLSTVMLLALYAHDPAQRPAGAAGGASPADLLSSWLQNATLVQTFFNNPLSILGWNAPAWSVSCEAVFYLAFPAMLWRLERLQRPRAIAGLAAVTWLATFGGVMTACVVLHVAARQNAVDLEFWTYHAPYLRIGEFATGCLAGLWFVRRGENPWPSRVGRETAAWGGLLGAMTIGALQNYGKIPLLVSNGAIFTPAFAVATVAVSSGPTSLGRLLSGKALGRLGEASYSLYLVHSIPAVLIGRLLDGRAGTPLALAAIVVSVGASMVLFHAVEDPCRHLLRTRRPKARPVPATAPAFEPALAAAA